MDGVKNSVVVLILVVILVEFEVVLEGLLDILDVYIFYNILEEFGGMVCYDNKIVVIDLIDMIFMLFLLGNVKKLCVFYYLMGVMLGWFKKVVIGFLGGCYLGLCLID